MGISIVPRKYFRFLIQYFDFKAGRNQINVFEVKRMANETVKTISVEKIYISQKRVIFAADNTNTNFSGLR